MDLEGIWVHLQVVLLCVLLLLRLHLMHLLVLLHLVLCLLPLRLRLLLCLLLQLLVCKRACHHGLLNHAGGEHVRL